MDGSVCCLLPICEHFSEVNLTPALASEHHGELTRAPIDTLYVANEEFMGYINDFTSRRLYLQHNFSTAETDMCRKTEGECMACLNFPTSLFDSRSNQECINLQVESIHFVGLPPRVRNKVLFKRTSKSSLKGNVSTLNPSDLSHLLEPVTENSLQLRSIKAHSCLRFSVRTNSLHFLFTNVHLSHPVQNNAACMQGFFHVKRFLSFRLLHFPMSDSRVSRAEVHDYESHMGMPHASRGVDLALWPSP